MQYYYPYYYYNRVNPMPAQSMYQPNLDEAIKGIKDAVLGEENDQGTYTYLASIAPNIEAKNIITSIRDDEVKHDKMFRKLYFMLTKQELPEATTEKFTKPRTYCEGIKNAIMGETAAVVRYRKILFGLQQREHINMLGEIITDEIRHASLYNLLYSMAGCR